MQVIYKSFEILNFESKHTLNYPYHPNETNHITGGNMIRLGINVIRRPPRLLTSSFASTRTPRCHHVSSFQHWNLRPGFEAQTRETRGRWF